MYEGLQMTEDKCAHSRESRGARAKLTDTLHRKQSFSCGSVLSCSDCLSMVPYL